MLKYLFFNKLMLQKHNKFGHYKKYKFRTVGNLIALILLSQIVITSIYIANSNGTEINAKNLAVSIGLGQNGVQGNEENNFPIVFIHGAGGFGEDELFGFDYWGGLHSIPDYLRSLGYTVYVLKVGPLSSSWDRAVEAFYELKGGTVDYGIAHSQKYGHNRFGRTFQGLYPEWGTLNPDGTRKKIHIIAHSMGGQTSRALNALLSGIYIEQGNSSLFAESHPDWIASITTISTTHDGTSLVMPIKSMSQFLCTLVGGFAAFIGQNPIYDLMLDQWNLTRQEGESIFDFIERASSSTLFNENSKDTALWDALPQGAAQLNGWTPANPDIYYFSFSSSATVKLPFSDRHIPSVTMTPVFYAGAVLMGSLQGTDGTITINKDWFENDGVVNTISMTGPKSNSSDSIVAFDKNNIQPGVWNAMPKLNYDHMQILGINSPWHLIREMYLNHVKLLYSLPKGDPVEISQNNEQVSETIEELNNIEPISQPEDNVYTDPNSYANGSEPSEEIYDQDNDTIWDLWEDQNGLDKNNPNDAFDDNDNDNLKNLAEFALKTNPNSADSDSDSLSDFSELIYSLNPHKRDADLDYDLDGLTNIEEIQYKTDAWNSDTDGDGFSDNYEIQSGSDPLDKFSTPAVNPILTTAQIVGLIVIFGCAGFFVIGYFKGMEIRYFAHDSVVRLKKSANKIKEFFKNTVESFRARSELRKLDREVNKKYKNEFE
ncbi:MAG: lipase-like domain-containing protein [Promethearchaeota archaeon]